MAGARSPDSLPRPPLPLFMEVALETHHATSNHTWASRPLITYHLQPRGPALSSFLLYCLLLLSLGSPFLPPLVTHLLSYFHSRLLGKA